MNLLLPFCKKSAIFKKELQDGFEKFVPEPLFSITLTPANNGRI